MESNLTPEEFAIQILNPKGYGGHTDACIIGEYYNIQIWILDVDWRQAHITAETPSGKRCFMRNSNGDNPLLSHYDLLVARGPGRERSVFDCNDEGALQAALDLTGCSPPRDQEKQAASVPPKMPQEAVGSSNKKRGKPNVATTENGEVCDSRPAKRIRTSATSMAIPHSESDENLQDAPVLRSKTNANATVDVKPGWKAMGNADKAAFKPANDEDGESSLSDLDSTAGVYAEFDDEAQWEKMDIGSEGENALLDPDFSSDDDAESDGFDLESVYGDEDDQDPESTCVDAVLDLEDGSEGASESEDEDELGDPVYGEFMTSPEPLLVNDNVALGGAEKGRYPLALICLRVSWRLQLIGPVLMDPIAPNQTQRMNSSPSLISGSVGFIVRIWTHWFPCMKDTYVPKL